MGASVRLYQLGSQLDGFMWNLVLGDIYEIFWNNPILVEIGGRKEISDILHEELVTIILHKSFYSSEMISGL